MLYTNPCGVIAVRMSITQENYDVRRVSTIICRCQHCRTHTGKCSRRVCTTSWFTEWSDGWLKWRDWRVVNEVEDGSNACTVGDETHACTAAVDIQSANKTGEKLFHEGVVTGTDASRPIHDKNDVDWTIRRTWNCNRIFYELYLSHHVVCLRKLRAASAP